jgi:four helix bundle protein
MDTGEFKNRTKAFGIWVINLVAALPSSISVYAIARQLVKCSSSVGANYRAACRARSTADFIAKLKIVEEECDESMYWLEVIVEAGLMKEHRVAPLHKEANEILSIVVASIRTTRTRSANRKS